MLKKARFQPGFFMYHNMNIKNRFTKSEGLVFMVRPSGIEPPHMAPEANALSTELRAHSVRTLKL